MRAHEHKNDGSISCGLANQPAVACVASDLSNAEVDDLDDRQTRVFQALLKNLPKYFLLCNLSRQLHQTKEATVITKQTKLHGHQ